MTNSGRGPGFVFVQFSGFLVFSCYWRPGCPLREFEGFLSGLEAELRRRLRSVLTVVFAGDFNAKSRSWGSSVDNARGAAVKRLAASLGLWPENVGSVPTFAVGDGNRRHIGLSSDGVVH